MLEKQTRASRGNACKSTGPKTPAGKQTARMNALKHGILAKEVVIEYGDGGENKPEFEELLSQPVEYWQPEGIQEDLLVEHIAVDRRAATASHSI